MIGLIGSVLGGAVLIGVGIELVAYAVTVESLPLIACLAFACGVLMAAVGVSVLRCTAEVSRER